MTDTLKERRDRVQQAIKRAQDTAGKKKTEFIAGFGEEMEKRLEVVKVRTGVPALDVMLRGGIARGRITEIYGAESAGKSTLAFHILRAFHQSFPDEIVVYSVNETYDPRYRAMLNLVADDRFVIDEAECLEDSLNFCIDMAETRAISCMVIDSIVGLGSRKEHQSAAGVRRDLDSQGIPPTPATLSKFLRMSVGKISKGRMALVVTNQVRTAGIGGVRTFDDVTGGKALRHYKSASIAIRRSHSADNAPKSLEESQPIGFGTTMTLVKDKMGGIEGSKISVPFVFGQGFISTHALARAALDVGIIDHSGGGRYTIFDEKLQGQKKLFAYLEENQKKTEEALYDKTQTGGIAHPGVHGDRPGGQEDAADRGGDRGKKTGRNRTAGKKTRSAKGRGR